MSDLKSKKAIYLKAVLFLVMIILSSVMLMIEEEKWKRALFIAVLIWSSARLYYFMFYVIEKYVDSEFRFSSVFSFILYLCTKKNPK